MFFYILIIRWVVNVKISEMIDGFIYIYIYICNSRKKLRDHCKIINYSDVTIHRYVFE